MAGAGSRLQYDTRPPRLTVVDNPNELVRFQTFAPPMPAGHDVRPSDVIRTIRDTFTPRAFAQS